MIAPFGNSFCIFNEEPLVTTAADELASKFLSSIITAGLAEAASPTLSD
jgi:hypothetical protein